VVAKAVVAAGTRLVVVRELRGVTQRGQWSRFSSGAWCTVTGDNVVQWMGAGGAAAWWAGLDQVDGDGAGAAATARVPAAAAAAAAAGVAHVGGDGATRGEGAEDIAEAAAEEGVAEERITEQGERHGQQ